MVNCTGHPPSAGTSHRLLRPVMLVIKAICLPSGDHAVPPTIRVMYSFSIDKFFSTAAFDFDVICLGSVMACGAGRVSENDNVLMRITITGMSMRMDIRSEGKSLTI